MTQDLPAALHQAARVLATLEDDSRPESVDPVELLGGLTDLGPRKR